MPDNAKIIYFGRTLMDVTQDTVTADKMYKGIKAHDAKGDVITGTAEVIDDGEGHVTLPPGFVTLTGG